MQLQFCDAHKLFIKDYKLPIMATGSPSPPFVQTKAKLLMRDSKTFGTVLVTNY